MNLFRSRKVDESEMYIWFVVPAGYLFGRRVSLTHSLKLLGMVLRKQAVKSSGN